MRNVALGQDAGIDGYISGERNYQNHPGVGIHIAQMGAGSDQ